MDVSTSGAVVGLIVHVLCPGHLLERFMYYFSFLNPTLTGVTL